MYSKAVARCGTRKSSKIERAQNRVLFQLHEPDLDRELPDVPVMSETLLLMELMVRERASSTSARSPSLC